jgi:hypothetical protein
MSPDNPEVEEISVYGFVVKIWATVKEFPMMHLPLPICLFTSGAFRMRDSEASLPSMKILNAIY